VTAPIRAYILGVPGRYRGQQLEADLAGRGIGFEVVAGPDPATWTDGQLDRLYSRRAAQIVSRRQLAPAEVACTLGHQDMMRRFVAEGSPWALFLEDDAVIIQGLDPLQPVLDALAARPVVLDLDRRRRHVTPPTEVLPYVGGTVARMAIPDVGTAGYLMSRPAAVLALHAYRRRRVDSTADWPFCWRDRVQFWQPDTDFVHHPKGTGLSLVGDGRQRSYRESGERSGAKATAVALLRVSGVTAAAGRLSNVPFVPLFRRDRTLGLAALRGR
jgi:GR25 family glycosyltransferase involved in LPS biosynthesis